MAALGSLIVKLALDYAQYTQGLNKSEQEAMAAAKRIQDTVDSVRESTGEFFKGLAGGIAAGLSVAGVVALVNGVTQASAAVGDLAVAAGTTTEKLSGMAQLGAYTGQTAETISAAMGQLTRRLVETKDATTPAGAALQALGLNIQEFKRLDPADQMLAVAKSLDKFEDGAGKSAAAMALLGESGAQMLPYIKDLATAGDLQALVTDKQSAAADEFQRHLTRVAQTNKAYTTELVNGAVPGLNLAFKAYEEVMNGVGGVREYIRQLAADGTLSQWVTTAVKGLSYIVDVGQYVMRTLKSLGTVIAGVLSAVRLVMDGNFSGAMSVLKESANDAADAFRGETLGEQFRAKLDGLATSATGAADAVAKPTLAINNLARAAKGGGNDVKKLQHDYDEFIKSLNEKVAQQALELDGGKKLAESDKLRIKYQEELKDKFKGLTAAQREKVELLLKEIAANERALELAKERQEEVKWRQSLQTAIATSVADLEASNKTLAEEIGLIGLSVAQRAAVLYQRENAILLVKEQRLAELQLAEDAKQTMSQTRILLEQEIEARRKNLALTSVKASREASAAASAASLQQWHEGVRQLGQSLTDQLMAGGQSFGDYLKNLARTLLFRPTIQAAATTIFGTGAGQGASGSGSGGILGALQSGQSLWSIFSGGTSGALATGVASLGKLMGSSVLAELSSGIAAGGQLGISGAASLMGSASGTTGLGMALGAAAPWLVGGLALASAWSSLFGREHEQKNLQGTFGGDAGFVGNWHDYYRGGLFSSSKTVNTPLDDATRSGLADQFNAMRSSTAAMAQVLGLGTDAISAFTASVNIKLKDLSAEEAQQKIQEEFGKISDSLARTALGTEQYSRAGETATVTLTRLSTSLAVANSALDTLGLTLYSQTLASADLASRMIDAVGGTQAFAQAINGFQQNYYSEAERMETLSRQVRAAMTSLDLSIDPALGDEAKAQFRAVVTGALESGNVALASSLLALQDSFATAADYAQASANTIAQAAIEQAQATAQASAEAAQAAADLARGLRDSLTELEARFVDGGFARRYGAEDLAGQVRDMFAGLGIDKSAQALAEQISAARAADVEEFFRSMYAMLPTDEARQQLVMLSGALLDFSSAADQAAQAAIDAAAGQVDAIAQYRGSLADAIESARMQGMSGADRASYLRSKEAGLWSQLDNAADPVAVAQKLQQTILDRISAEADLRFTVEDQTLANLKSQLTVAQAMSGAVAGMQSAVDGLRLGSMSALNPYTQLQYAGSKFDDAYARALAGDVGAWKDVQSYGNSYVQLGRDNYASSTQSADIFFKVTEAMDRLIGMGIDADPQVAALNTQIELMTSSRDNSEQQLWVSQQQVDALGQLDAVMAREQQQAQQRHEQLLAEVRISNEQRQRLIDLEQAAQRQQAQIAVEQKARDGKLIAAAEKTADAARVAEAQA